LTAQAPDSVALNADYFAGESYAREIELDTFRRIGEAIEHRDPPGRWITQFGRRWPTALTPARAYVVVGRSRPR
jgi:hypothetical protein